MVKMINKSFGNEMWVAEERTGEYLTAGHALAKESIAKEQGPETRTKERKSKVKPKR